MNSSSGTKIHAVLRAVSVLHCAKEAYIKSNSLGVGISFSMDKNTRACIVACGQVKSQDLVPSSSSRTYVIPPPKGKKLL